MKLTKEQKLLNMKIQSKKDDHTLNADAFYEQFDDCPFCNQKSNGVDTTSNPYLSGIESIEHRCCKQCGISWSYTRYLDITKDPSYMSYVKKPRNPLGPKPPPLARPQSRVVTEGCLIYIMAGVSIIGIIGGILLL